MTLLRLGSLVAEASDQRRQSLPHMHWLNARTGESIELHVRQNDAHVALEVVPGRQTLRYLVLPGASFPLHQGAIGQVLLAYGSRGARGAGSQEYPAMEWHCSW
jgi:DNA-binding IclR family transcriptional regulator